MNETLNYMCPHQIINLQSSVRFQTSKHRASVFVFSQTWRPIATTTILWGPLSSVEDIAQEAVAKKLRLNRMPLKRKQKEVNSQEAKTFCRSLRSKTR